MDMMRVISEDVTVIKPGKIIEGHDCNKVFKWAMEFNHDSPVGTQERLQICKICGRMEKVSEKLEPEETFEQAYKRFHGDDYRKE